MTSSSRKGDYITQILSKSNSLYIQQMHNKIFADSYLTNAKWGIAIPKIEIVLCHYYLLLRKIPKTRVYSRRNRVHSVERGVKAEGQHQRLILHLKKQFILFSLGSLLLNIDELKSPDWFIKIWSLQFTMTHLYDEAVILGIKCDSFVILLTPKRVT